MKISELPISVPAYTQLGSRVLAVLVRREDGWCVYVNAVPGEEHAIEWREVMRTGDKQKEPVARAIVENLFYPGFEVDVEYAR